MSKETLEELKAIIDNAPKCGTATHIDQRGSYIKDCFVGCQFYHSRIGWVEFDRAVRMRSLSDIKAIIELMEQVKASYEAYSRIESVKQRYNAENKQLKEALKGVMVIFASVPDGIYRNELRKARKALGYDEALKLGGSNNVDSVAQRDVDWFRSCGEDI